MLHIGVGIVFATRSGILGTHVVHEEVQFLQCFTILGMPLAVEHERLGHFVVAFFHERHLHLVLNVLDGDALVDVEVGDYLAQGGEVDGFVNRFERLDDSVHNLIKREAHLLPIAFGDAERNDFHGN